MLIYKDSFPVSKGAGMGSLPIPSIFLINGQICPSFQWSVLNISSLDAQSVKIRCTRIRGSAAWKSLSGLEVMDANAGNCQRNETDFISWNWLNFFITIIVMVINLIKNSYCSLVGFNYTKQFVKSLADFIKRHHHLWWHWQTEMFPVCIPEGICLVLVVTTRNMNIQPHWRRRKMNLGCVKLND